MAVGSNEGGRRTRMSLGMGVEVEVARWKMTANKADRRSKHMAGGRLSGKPDTVGTAKKKSFLYVHFMIRSPKQRD